MRVASRTEVGLVRERNEDDLLVDEQHRWFVVADGLGGHPGGDVASALAVGALRAAADAGQGPGDALHAAHDAVLEAAERDGPLGMGTTAVLAHLAEDDRRLTVAHVGDSRGYVLARGELLRLTTDHNVGGALTQALGTPGSVEPDVVQIDLDPGDRILLCTDGLTNMVDDDAVATMLAAEGSPQEVVDQLVEAAISGGGIDNVTVIVIEIDG